jgi:hypothetical protein
MSQEELRVRALGAVQDDLVAPLHSATVIESAEGVTTFAGVGDDPDARRRMDAALKAVAKTFPSSDSNSAAEASLDQFNGSSE